MKCGDPKNGINLRQWSAAPHHVEPEFEPTIITLPLLISLLIVECIIIVKVMPTSSYFILFSILFLFYHIITCPMLSLVAVFESNPFFSFLSFVADEDLRGQNVLQLPFVIDT